MAVLGPRAKRLSATLDEKGPDAPDTQAAIGGFS